MKGFVTSIQRFSLQDGPGIRTTVFLAGCNLRCKWCHNPETLTGGAVPMLYPMKCIGCGACFAVCPTGARGEAGIDRETCINCGKCAAACDPKAIVLSQKEMSPEEVLAEVRQDRLYYQESGGGMTLSGGEALCQKEFAEELIELCNAEGIATAVETNLLHDFAEIEPILKKVSLVMADIKILDSEEHRKWTGAGNEKILENAKKLGALGVPIIFRTPLIPGATDSEENLRGIAAFVAQIPNVLRYEILNFNPLGAGKYDAMGRENPFVDARPFDSKRLEAIREMLSESGVALKIS